MCLSEMSLVETSFEIDLYSYERGCRQGSDVCQSSCPERYPVQLCCTMPLYTLYAFPGIVAPPLFRRVCLLSCSAVKGPDIPREPFVYCLCLYFTCCRHGYQDLSPCNMVVPVAMRPDQPCLPCASVRVETLPCQSRREKNPRVHDLSTIKSGYSIEALPKRKSDCGA